MCSNPLFQDGDKPLVAGGERPLGAVDQPEGVDHLNAALAEAAQLGGGRATGARAVPRILNKAAATTGEFEWKGR